MLANLSNCPELAVELGGIFAAAGHELALVGGTVRDLLLGRESEDLDFATSARPDQTEAILAKWADSTWDIGKEFGTIGAIKHVRGADGVRGQVTIEITTYRDDDYEASSRKPVVKYGDNLDGDLSRRDLTINSMALRVPSMVFVDPFDGLSDLVSGMLRTPVDPMQSFDDDPLRMMRVARFAAQLGFRVAGDTAEAILKMAPRLEIVSAERIQAELNKLMLAPNPILGLTLLVDTGLAVYVVPELVALQLEIDEHHRHKDVYTHSLQVLKQAIDLETGPDGDVPRPDLVLRLAALLHDAGKPATRRFEKNGGVSFHGHDVVGARIIKKRLKALKYDKQIVNDVARLIELHLRFHGYGEGVWTDAAVRRYVTDAGPLLERLHCLTRADCTTRNVRKAQRLSAIYDELEMRISALRLQEKLDAIRPDLSGNDIMELLDIPPGPLVGKAYQHMLALRMEQGPMESEAAKAALFDWAKENLPVG
ncbi:MAG: CCA tRNA nucleotidyltransferase [Cellulomonadaceae bacterium]|jgi:poly(A) polymerase|nr:CCA tRNA nucleotidyltransferase [Cellulomonadaceae bacterium]